MNRNEIVRQYKWLRILRVFLIMFSGILMFLLTGLAYAIIVFVTIGVCAFLSERLGWSELYCFFVLWLIMCVFLFIFMVKKEEPMNKTSRSISNKPSNILFRHYEKKWGMTEPQIKNYIAKREELGKRMDIYVFPYIRRFCNLNEEGRKEQESFLSGYLSEDEIIFVYRQIYSDSLMPELNKYWRKRPLSEKKPLLDLLFKLAIVQDGIRNDEWNLLMSIMMQWGFNKNYIEFYKDRYSPLRTEFDEFEYRRSVSTEDHSVSYLKPYFEILGLDENATDEEIKRAYHNLALQHHPDLPRNAARIEECETLMAKLNEAYEKIRK